MDTYKRSIRGLQSRSNGEYFEGMIIAASRFYEERGIAAVDKTPEAFKVLKAMDRNRGQFICCFTKQAQPDFKGILMDSTMILFDAKHTDKDKISRDVVTAEQQACFERYMKLGVSIIEGGYNDISGVEAGKVNKGEDVDILIKDIGFVIASAEIKKGQEVTATTGGKAAVAAAGDYVIGVALNNVSAGGYSRLQLSKYQKAKA